MKIAFITHDVSVYGASRSLRNLVLELNKQHEIYIIIPKLYRKKNNIENVANWFKLEKSKILEFRLPYSDCFIGKIKRKFINVSWIKNIKWMLIDKYFLYNYLKIEAFDFIHLNSIVLHEVLNKYFKMIIHIREVYDGKSMSFIRNIVKAKGIIFIDIVTKEKIKELKLNKNIILNNPFDMTVLNKYCNKEKNIDFPISIDWEGKVVFSIIGSVIEQKGVLFIINTFMQYINTNALLLIIGSSYDNAYLRKCYEAIESDPRIIIYGEEKEIEKFYFISDYILRGEPFVCVGRTTYEALYAGLHIIIPGNAGYDENKYFDYYKFSDKIHFYKPRDSISLIEILNNCEKKINDKIYLSNTEEYAKSFINFIKT